MSISFLVLIPAYEPGEAFLELLPQVQAAGFEIIIINDGSGADYAPLFEKAAEYGTVLTHDVNRGKGCALKTGYAYIQEHFSEKHIIVTVDAEGQHRIEDALAICALAKEHPDSLVLGSRKLNDNVPLRSQFGNSLTRLIYRLSTGLKVHDTQTGLRAFSTDFLPQMLEIPGERYEYEMNVLLEFARKKVPILEHEIETIYLNNNESSHFHVLKDSYRVYKEILKFSASSFIGFLVDYCMYGILLLVMNAFGATWGLSYLQGVRISNIGARIVSASVNYTLNRKFVFRSSKGFASSAFGYFLLALIILIGNTIVLEFLVGTLGIFDMLAKIITEFAFFLLSWSVQKCIIFRNKDTTN